MNIILNLNGAGLQLAKYMHLVVKRFHHVTLC